MVNYKLFVPKGTPYYDNYGNTNDTTKKDYWTTVQLENEDNSPSYIVRQGKQNLAKQIAQNEYRDIRFYRYIELDSESIQIVK